LLPPCYPFGIFGTVSFYGVRILFFRDCNNSEPVPGMALWLWHLNIKKGLPAWGKP